MLDGQKFVNHAVLRAFQRFPGVCPGLLVDGISWAIKRNRHDLIEFVEWQGEDRGIWKGLTANGQKFRAVANPINGFVITIMPGWPPRKRRSRKR